MVDVESIENYEISWNILELFVKLWGFGGKNCQFGQNVVWDQ
jgi:hypothetical protein